MRPSCAQDELAIVFVSTKRSVEDSQHHGALDRAAAFGLSRILKS